jgi:hypothetical protein
VMLDCTMEMLESSLVKQDHNQEMQETWEILAQKLEMLENNLDSLLI